MIRIFQVCFSLTLTVLLFPVPCDGKNTPLRRTKDGFYVTGTGIRVKKLMFVPVEVYQATHQMRIIPRDTSKRGVINADVDKRTIITMLRDINIKRIVKGIRDAYEMNDCHDTEKVDTLLSVLNEDLKEGDTFMIAYDSRTKTVKAVTRKGTASVRGYEFMRYTWKTWFGKIDMPELGDMLISEIQQGPSPPDIR